MSDCVDTVAVLKAVTHRYGAVAALENIDLQVPARKMVGLIGPDGVGKSTLLALIAGVRKIQTGQVQVLGGDMGESTHRRNVCAQIAYMPQGLGHNLYPTLSVHENIDFFGRLFGQNTAERAWRIEDLLESTDLTEFADRPAGKLSGGMKQKLSLCCALIHDPDLLILDEPTTGVDPLSRKQFWELIGRVRRRRAQMSVIVATAYMEEANGFDHLIAMDAGKVLAEGSSHDLKSLTQTGTLDEAFIALLPEARRAQHHTIVLPPRKVGIGVPAIRAVDLTQRFGNFTAVDHVSVSIEKGEIFGFLGSNGSGKTTTMKMLTGLLKPTEGHAELFGVPVGGGGLADRKRVGYMSQSFSLYTELTVRQNLKLHADLFQLNNTYAQARIIELMGRFDLERVADQLPDGLPLGVRQRLQLAVAVLHKPEILILDEPTSGVDPIARDVFWDLLIELSRRDGVTIFISTHFVNEAERCDRISLMHAGKILAVDTPGALQKARVTTTLEEAFIGYLEDAAGTKKQSSIRNEHSAPMPAATPTQLAYFNSGRYWAFARREALELFRDPIRLTFALLGPIVLLCIVSFGISFDVEKIRYAVFDQDQTTESRIFLENFANSRYFKQLDPVTSPAQMDRRMINGDLAIVIMVPPNFGRDVISGRQPDVGVWLDGSNTARAETSRGYVQGVLAGYLMDGERRLTGHVSAIHPASVETRFRYNQAFLSINAVTPGVLMMVLIMVPAMLTALGVVREKELGSIINLYAAPASKLEFLLGKQLPYIALSMVGFFILYAIIRFVFGVPMAGSFPALLLGAFLFVSAGTALGLVISAFVTSQIAAIFASAMFVMIPTINFSGMVYPVSALNGTSRIVSMLWPATYFRTISSGTFNKGLGVFDLWPSYVALIGFCLVFWALSSALLKKQEA
jgi:ribosome-dependent ATPase